LTVGASDDKKEMQDLRVRLSTHVPPGLASTVNLLLDDMFPLYALKSTTLPNGIGSVRNFV
jgi:hypothetical protein